MKPSNLAFFLFCFVNYSKGLSVIYMKYFKQKAMDIVDYAIPKDDCSRHLQAMISDMFNLKKLWAMKMLDASAKPQSGFLVGNILHFGSYDECLGIREDKGELGVIEGQYCTVALTPSKNTTSDLGQILDFSTSISDILGIRQGKDLKHILKHIRVIYGLCLPKSCNADSIQKLWNYMEYTFRLPVHVTVGDDFCSYKGKISHEFGSDTIVIWGFVIFFTFLCIASIYDIAFVRERKEKVLWDEILLSFSLFKNGKIILDSKSSPNEDTTFSCLNGLKVFSMLWIVLGHKYTLDYFSGSVNMLEYFEFKDSLSALVITTAPFAVDTFFVISGLLLAFKYMQVREVIAGKRPFPYFTFYFMRLLRLWPCILATVFLYANILKYLNDGPLWQLIEYKTALSCRYTGWITALFATNFVNFQYQCLEPSWYLAVDTQLYIIAPLLLYFLYKYPNRTSVFIILLAASSAIYSYYVTVTTKEKWSPADGDNTFYYRIYQSPFVRMPAWLFGVLNGYFLYNFQHIKLPKGLVQVLWFLPTVLLVAVFYVNHVMGTQPYNEYSAGLYNALTRPAWAISICLIIFLCASGHGGIVNEMLSKNIYKPLVRISYSVFLMHSAIIMLLHGGKRSSTFHSLFTTFHSYLSDILFILIGSFMWCLAFESPFISLAKILTKKQLKDDSRQTAIVPAQKRLRKEINISKHIYVKPKKNE